MIKCKISDNIVNLYECAESEGVTVYVKDSHNVVSPSIAEQTTLEVGQPRTASVESMNIFGGD